MSRRIALRFWLIWLVILPLAACGGSPSVKYTSTECGLSLTFPEGWEVEEETLPEEGLVRMTAGMPANQDSENLHPLVVIATCDATHTCSNTPDKAVCYIEYTSQRMTEAWQNVAFITDLTTLKIGGRPAASRIATGPIYNGEPPQYLYLFAVEPPQTEQGVIYLWGIINPEDWAGFQGVIEKIANSMRFE